MSYSVVEAIDDLLAGEDIEEIIENMTKGYVNALKKQENGSKYACVSCEYVMPVYTGTYPQSCPICGGSITSNK